MSDEEKIEISKAEYDRLKEDAEKFQALECAGVDNWVGWDEAMDMYNNWQTEKND